MNSSTNLETINFINYCLKKEKDNLTIKNLKEVNHEIILSIHKFVFNGLPQDVEVFADTKEIQTNNIHILLESLSREFLNVSLSHITAGDIVNTDIESIINLMGIYRGINDYMTTKSDKEKSMKKLTKYKNSDRSMKLTRKNSLIDQAQEEEEEEEVTNAKYSQLRQQLKETESYTTNLENLAHGITEPTEVNPPSAYRASSMSANKKCEKDRTQYLHTMIQHVMKKRPDTPWQYSKAKAKNQSNPNDFDQYIRQHEVDLINAECFKLNNEENQESNLQIVEVDFEDDDSESETIRSDETYLVTLREKPKKPTEEKKSNGTNNNNSNCVNPDLLEMGYQHNFLDMLLEEEQNLMNVQEKANKKQDVLRLCASSHDSRPVINHDSHKTGNKCDTFRLPLSARSNGSSGKSKPINRGFVRPVVKHLRTQTKNVDSLYNGSKRPNPSLKDMGLVTRLLDEFPGLHVNENTIKHLWNIATRHSEYLTQQNLATSSISRSNSLPSSRKLQEAGDRQRLLLELVNKEVDRDRKVRERREEQKASLAARQLERKQRHRRVKLKRNYQELQAAQIRRMSHREQREEAVLSRALRAAMSIQKERVREAKKNARDVEKEMEKDRLREMDALEKYYRDRFSMLGEALREERNKIKMQDRSQEQEIIRMKSEMRHKLQSDIRELQTSLLQTDSDTYFRQLDANAMLSRI